MKPGPWLSHLIYRGFRLLSKLNFEGSSLVKFSPRIFEKKDICSRVFVKCTKFELRNGSRNNPNRCVVLCGRLKVKFRRLQSVSSSVLSLSSQHRQRVYSYDRRQKEQNAMLYNMHLEYWSSQLRIRNKTKVKWEHKKTKTDELLSPKMVINVVK